MTYRIRGLSVVLAVLAGAGTVLGALDVEKGPNLVSATKQGDAGNGSSWQPSISWNGKVVAWYGEASDLVNKDENEGVDVFHYDIKKGQIDDVRGQGNSQFDDDSEGVSLSGNGRIVVFATWSDALFDLDVNGEGDVYAYDRKTGELDLVSVAADGGASDGESFTPFGGAVSANGRYVVFMSSATNLVEGGTDGTQLIYVRDRKKGTTTLVSLNGNGEPANDNCEEPTISGNGRVVAYISRADNLYPDEETPRNHIYLHDVKKGLTTRVSETEAGVPGDDNSREPSLNKNGKLLAFQFEGDNLVPGATGRQHYLYDAKQRTLQVLSLDMNGNPATGSASVSALSANGKVFAFSHTGSNFVPGDTYGDADVYVRDLKKGTIERISILPDGTEPDRPCYVYPGGIDKTGRRIVFETSSTTFAESDENGRQDVFYVDRKAK